MLKNRIKLIAVIFFTIIYMLSALLWWTIALTKLQTNEYSKDIEIAKLKKSLVVNKIIFSAQKVENYSINKTTILIDNQLFKVDTFLLNDEIINEKKNFIFFYTINRQHNCLELRLQEKDDIHLKLAVYFLEKLKFRAKKTSLRCSRVKHLAILLHFGLHLFDRGYLQVIQKILFP